MSASGWTEKKIEGTTSRQRFGSGLKEEVHCGNDYLFPGAERYLSCRRSSSVERGAVDSSRQDWKTSPLWRALRTPWQKSLPCHPSDYAKSRRRGRRTARLSAERLRPYQGFR